jgi:hypothetical protein
VFLCGDGVSAGTTVAGQMRLLKTLDLMMVSLASESLRDSQAIKDAYVSHLDLLVLDKYSAVERALYNGGLARLPSDPARYNLAPRVNGLYPIGEKDIENQLSYIAARPAAIGALLTVAARVKSGPIEITSLVRHTEYQGALMKTNANATTPVPTHTMGLAFDIGLVNATPRQAYEIRDVLRKMRDAGDILFIGERQQLVFHVVPHPSRLGYFTDVYTRALGAPAAANGTPVAGFPIPGEPVGLLPTVDAEVTSIVPAPEVARAWWATDGMRGDLGVEVSAVRAREWSPLLVAPAKPTSVSSAPLIALLAGALALVPVYRRSREPESSIKSLLTS